MSNPFFSVLIPVYNVEKYLSACLESVLHQSFTDYEIILVDDGSKDTSGLICDRYHNKHPEKIRVHHKTNQGQLSARVAGLKLAAGKYACFLDSDDCWPENTLERLFNVIQTTGSDIVLYQWELMDERGTIIKDSVSESLFPTGIIQKKEVFQKMLTTSGLNSLCKKCCRLELFDREKDYSNYYKYKNGEDMLQSLPVMFRAESFFCLNEALYLYRSNPSSITHNYQKGQYRTQNIMRPMLYEYIEKLGMDTPENKMLFFQTYLSSVWEDIVALFRNTQSGTERYTALEELRSYDFVTRAEGYVKAAKMPLSKKIGYFLFYAGNNSEMDAYMKVYLLGSQVKHSICYVLLKVKHLLMRG